MSDIFTPFEHLELEGWSKSQLRTAIERIRKTKVNVLLVGGTGVGKSSTINALFKDNRANVGQGAEPETAELKAYEWDNLVIWDPPGFGDSAANDQRYKEEIKNKLHEKDAKGLLLIDLVLLVLDGGSRDFSSAYTIIKDVIVPNLAETDKNRLLVAINKADKAANSWNDWDREANKPTEKLETELQKRLESTRRRIKEDTGLDADVIYYMAGSRDGEETQKSYNMEKLLSHILTHLPVKKRAVIMQDVNRDESVFSDNDDESNYREKISKFFKESVWENIKFYASEAGVKMMDVGKEVADKSFQLLKSELAKSTSKQIALFLVGLLFPKKGK